MFLRGEVDALNARRVIADDYGLDRLRKCGTHRSWYSRWEWWKRIGEEADNATSLAAGDTYILGFHGFLHGSDQAMTCWGEW